jgi:hypothetical protein
MGFLQERNEHNLLNDFLDEVSGHQFSRSVKGISDSLWEDLESRFDNNSVRYVGVYSALVDAGLLGDLDLKCVREFTQIANSFAV